MSLRPSLPSRFFLLLFHLRKKRKRKNQRKERYTPILLSILSHPIPSIIVRVPSGHAKTRACARRGKESDITKLTRYEQETIINFNAGEEMATVYTRDPDVIRKIDTLVIEYPDTFRCIRETDIDKTYEMPKSAVTYRKPRKLSEEQREAAK